MEKRVHCASKDYTEHDEGLALGNAKSSTKEMPKRATPLTLFYLPTLNRAEPKAASVTRCAAGAAACFTDSATATGKASDSRAGCNGYLARAISLTGQVATCTRHGRTPFSLGRWMAAVHVRAVHDTQRHLEVLTDG